MQIRTKAAILFALVTLAKAQETGVTLWFWSSGTNSYKAITDDAGAFHLSGLTEGDYNSSVQKSGYTLPGSSDLDALQDPPKRQIRPGAEPVRYRFELIPPAVIRGRVIDADGNPAKASVELSPHRIVKTNADGSFAFENLTPGDYMLLARPMTSARPAEHSSEKDDIRAEVVPTYYDRSLAESGGAGRVRNPIAGRRSPPRSRHRAGPGG